MKAQVNGITLNYDIIGQEGLPVILIHGFGLDHSIWRTVATKFLGNQRVILPDVRGHGESDAPEEAYSMKELAGDISGLLDFLGITKATICGHSMGGYISLAFAAHFPERLAGLGLITTRAGADSNENRAGRYAMIEEIKDKGTAVLAESLAPRLTKDEDIIARSNEIILATPPQGIIGVLHAMAERPDRWNLLSEIRVPSLVVAGGEDQINNLDDSERMAEELPFGELMVIEDAGHMPMLEDYGALGIGLLSLVERVETFDDNAK